MFYENVEKSTGYTFTTINVCLALKEKSKNPVLLSCRDSFSFHVATKRKFPACQMDSMKWAILYVAVNVQQSPKVVFRCIFVVIKTEILAIAESLVFLRRKSNKNITF
jgi:hypothetical protein